MRLPSDPAGDPFATAALRDRVLAAWAASPARFREDANAEEDHARGGYRDRVIVELAQNAADAAARAGVPGRLHLALRDGVLTAANTGAPLDAAGVEALSTLRASAKRDQPGSAGRFGVGFAAVVAVSDAPSIVSRYAPDAGAAASGGTAGEADAAARSGTAAGEPGTGAHGAHGASHDAGASGHDPVSGRPPAAGGRHAGGMRWSEADGPGESDLGGPSDRARSGGARADGGPAVAGGGALAGHDAGGMPSEAGGPYRAGHRPVPDPAAHAAARAGGGSPVRGVCWSAERTRRAVAAIPVLADELGRRGGNVPVLRLPFALPDDEASVPEGFDTLVRLPLRDADAEALVRRLLAETGPALLLALPALAEVVIEAGAETRTLRAGWNRPPDAAGGTGSVVVGGTTWRTSEAHGAVAPDLMADRPVEERPFWQVRWAVAGDPLPDDVPAVVHAPTPSDEPLGLPALLIASFPLAPDRRHVAPGPLTDFLVERAAEAYLALLPPDPSLLDLVPGPVAKGELDAKIRRAILARLPDVPLLPIAVGRDSTDRGGTGRDGGAGRILVRGRDAVVVDGPAGLPEVLAEVVPGLLPAGWPARHPGLAALGVRRLGLADVADALAGLEREPVWWRRLYAALDGADRDALAGLPVPLADGRTVRGPRGLLVTDPEGLDALGLRIVHPEAVHPLLLRLGAVEAGPAAVLTNAATRAAVAASYDEDDPEPIWHAVLTLAERAALRPGDQPWLAELALPGADGDLYPAGELLLPDAPLGEVIAEDAPFGVVDGDLVERYGAGVLEAVGVLRTFALVRAEDVIEPGFHLDGEEEWMGRLGDGFVVPEFVAVRDLEFVADWPGALRLLAEPPLRAAVVESARAVLADGRTVTVPSYTAWWLRRHPVLDGRRPGELCMGDELAGLYDPAPRGLDAGIARALGVRTTVAALLAEPDGPAELLDRMADPGRAISRERLRALWDALSRVEELEVEPPDRVRALVDGEPEVVPAEDAIVVDRPDALPLLRGQPLLPVPVHLADALELSTAGDAVPGVIESSGSERPVPAVAREVLPGAPATYVHHERLVVDGQEIPWWYEDGVVHASGPAGLARGLAWACGRWADRLLAEAVLRDPDALPLLLAEADLG